MGIKLNLMTNAMTKNRFAAKCSEIINNHYRQAILEMETLIDSVIWEEIIDEDSSDKTGNNDSQSGIDR